MSAKTSKVQIGSPPNASHSKDALSLQITLPQMLDLALGTPEVGAVNLNILHNFLHVLLHQVNLHSTKVEFRGDEANRIKTVISASKTGPSLQLHEYSVITDPPSISTQGKRSSETGINADVYTNAATDHQDSSKLGVEERTAASAPVTARGKNGSDQDRTGGVPGAKRTRGSKHQIGSGINGERQSVIFVEPIVDGAVPTALGFKKLEETILRLQQRFEALDELATNPEMIKRVRGSKTDPLSDMWHVININKRLDGCEQGIEKLTTMTQDLIKGDKIEIAGGDTEAFGRLNERIIEVENQLAYLGGDMADLKTTRNMEENVPTDSLNAASPIPENSKSSLARENATKSSKILPGSGEPESPEVPVIGDQPESSNPPPTGDALPPKVTKSAKSSANVKNQQSTKSNPSDLKIKSSQERHSVIGGVDLTDLKNDVSAMKNEMIELKQNVEDLNSKMVDVAETVKSVDRPIASTSHAATNEKSALAVTSIQNTASLDDSKDPQNVAAASSDSETAGDELNLDKNKTASKAPIKNADFRNTGKKQAASMRGVHPESESPEAHPRELESRVSELEKEIGCVNEKLNVEALSALGSGGNGGIGDLIAKVEAIQADMEKMNAIASRLMDEKENRESHTDALIEQIELLKTIKADKEDLEEALADKADAQTVNRKVSHDQFDAACDDLARGLEDAITKLSQQESVWQEALDEVQREIEGKLDKIEISPLKEFVNNRLKLLQEKLKTLAAMRRENEAAGTKKMLSDVQCISCDSNAVMRMEEGAHYRAPTLPCSKSIKPYLTYELDQVRKQQRRLPHSRDMIQFEAAMQEMARKSKPLKEELSSKSPRDHLCNRYCGGSHTITTPQQRVMRMGHFLNQWGPEVIQLTEGVIRGNDGQLYRSRGMPGKQPGLGACGDAESPAEVPPATPPLSVPEPGITSQRESQIIRERSSDSQALKRSSLSQARKRSSARSGRVSEAIKEIKKEEVQMEPSTPPSGPPGTVVDDGETVPEPPGPIDEVVREVSLRGSQEDEEETLPESQG